MQTCFVVIVYLVPSFEVIMKYFCVLERFLFSCNTANRLTFFFHCTVGWHNHHCILLLLETKDMEMHTIEHSRKCCLSSYWLVSQFWINCFPIDLFGPVPSFFYDSSSKKSFFLDLDQRLEHTKTTIEHNHLPRLPYGLCHSQQQTYGLASNLIIFFTPSCCGRSCPSTNSTKTIIVVSEHAIVCHSFPKGQGLRGQKTKPGHVHRWIHFDMDSSRQTSHDGRKSDFKFSFHLSWRYLIGKNGSLYVGFCSIL